MVTVTAATVTMTMMIAVTTATVTMTMTMVVNVTVATDDDDAMVLVCMDGVHYKIKALEYFLKAHPEFQGKVVLMQVALQTTKSNKHASGVSDVIVHVNTTFLTLTYQLVVFLHFTKCTPGSFVEEHAMSIICISHSKVVGVIMHPGSPACSPHGSGTGMDGGNYDTHLGPTSARQGTNSGGIHRVNSMDKSMLVLATGGDEKLLRRLNELENMENMSMSRKGTNAKWKPDLRGQTDDHGAVGQPAMEPMCTSCTMMCTSYMMTENHLHDDGPHMKQIPIMGTQPAMLTHNHKLSQQPRMTATQQCQPPPPPPPPPPSTLTTHT
ncbi:hypothetical protein J3A83DRAFT_4188927 [Scleroderma citrinum]